MRPPFLKYAVLLGLSALITNALAWTAADTSGSDSLWSSSLANLRAVVANGSLATLLAASNVSQTCDLATAPVRKEYTSLSSAEKIAYSNAVSCLFSKDHQVPLNASAGVRSRYDDFVATHINQTMTIHLTGNFLYWHRYFIHAFESILRDECGYEGYLPYWNWGKSALDLKNSPYFDGSATSQSGNGVFEVHNASCALPTCLWVLNPGTGGGCVEDGPYANMILNISNTASTFGCPTGSNCYIPAGPFLGYQPRCFRRDVSDQYGAKWAADNNTVALLTWPEYSNNISSFQNQLQTTGNDTVGYFGLHGYGHLTINGDSSNDFYNSPNEPMFWLHHANVDRVFATWQNQQPLERTLTIDGPRYMADLEDLGEATLDDLMDLGFMDNFDGGMIKEHASIAGGKYCYIYE